MAKDFSIETWVRKQKEFRPLLGEKYDAELIDPNVAYLTSPKIDGIRCLLHASMGTVSRKLLEIPNTHVRSILDKFDRGLDGELISYTGDKMDDFNTTQSKVMSEDGTPQFKLCVFDDFTFPDAPFDERLGLAEEKCRIISHENILFLNHKPIRGVDALHSQAEYFTHVHGLEGMMARHPKSPYKYGRSTAKEGFLLKIKPMDRSTGVIMSVFEQMYNGNEATQNELGLTKRSSHKAGKIPKGTAGGFFVRHGATEVDGQGVVFKLATMEGITAAQRQEIWDNRNDYRGRLVDYDHQGVGTNGKPRIASLKGLRHRNDMSEG